MEATSNPRDLPCVILAGGRGTRLSEETTVVPKPMLTVGDKPLLGHVMDTYLKQGVRNFFIAVGHKQEIVRAYFLGQQPMFFSNDHRGGTQFQFEDYRVTVVGTGEDTSTGGRILRLGGYLKAWTDFFFTYGDGVANVNLRRLMFHHTKDSLATVTAVHPVGRFGRLRFAGKGDVVSGMGEKVEAEEDWINGGFAVLSTRLFLGITGDQTNLEKDVYPIIARYGFMRAYKHEGFWKCVDTLRDLEELRQIYKKDSPWLELL